MKTQKLFLSAVITALLFSCGKKETDATVDSEADKAAAVQDSIQKAEKIEAELIRQDSIDAIQIKGYKVKLVEGKHKYSDEKTKVEYLSLYKQIEEEKAIAAKEMWTDDKLKSNIDSYKSLAKGGTIMVNIERLTIDSANNDMITLIVKDEKDKEIFRKELDSDVANYSSSNDMWYNYGSALIPTRIKAPFYIYVVDKLQDVPLKYEVTPIK